ncbi:MAG: hypothetical protein RLN60_03575 [Phycisphaerales bacterium]
MPDTLTTGQETAPAPHGPRAAQLALFGVVVLSFVGFFVGIGNPIPQSQLSQGSPGAGLSPANEDAPPAVAYAHMDVKLNGPNRAWRTSLDHLVLENENQFAIEIASPETKRAALAERETRRAYNGAPPTVPHTIDQSSSVVCVACHREGLRAEGVLAPRMPHPFYASCTQCHVSETPPPVSATMAITNTFRGAPAPFEGERAWPGAPPTIPHTTLMRDDCLSCHGFTGDPGIRTSHPWRQSCTQCHAPSAELNQRIFRSVSLLNASGLADD